MTDQNNREKMLSHNKKIRSRVRKLQGQTTWLTRVPLADVYHFDNGIVRRVRFDVGRGVALPGLLKALLQDQVDEDGNLLYPVPVVHLRNNLDSDPETKIQEEIGETILNAVWKNKWIVLNGKHLLPFQVVKLLSNVLPTAADFTSYARRFCAPLIGNGYHTNHKFIIKDILSKNKEGQTILAGSDGDGRIHPNHPIMIKLFGDNNHKYPFQGTLVNVVNGTMFKGIWVPDERAVDSDGYPTIICDPGMIKGRNKASGKQLLGINRGAFDSDGVLIDESKLIELERGEGYALGILQTWDKPGKIAACFENLQNFDDNETTRSINVNTSKASLDKLTQEGGLIGILKKLARDRPNVDLCIKFCELIGADPLRVDFIWSLVEDDIQRYLFRLAQGMGLEYDGFTAVLDNGVPPGRCIIAPYRDKDTGELRYGHNYKVAVSRLPSTLPQSAMVLKNIDPRKPAWQYLIHHTQQSQLPNGDKTRVVNRHVIVMNQADLVDTVQGDADGDRMQCSDNKDIVTLHENRLQIPGFPKNAKFLVEGERVKDSYKSRIKVWDDEIGVPHEAIRFIGMDGMGPVGLLSMYQAAFYMMGMLMEALAMARLIQEAIDQHKNELVRSCPIKLSHRDNWKEVGESNVWQPIGCEASPDSKFYDENGMKIPKIAEWFFTTTGGAKLADVLTWRPEGKGSEKKRIKPSAWKQKPSIWGDNLVSWSNSVGHALYNEWEGENITSANRNVCLKELLSEALGITMPRSLDKSDSEDKKLYDELADKCYISHYQKALHEILDRGLEPEEKLPLIDAETHLLHSNLNKFVKNVKEAGGDPIKLLVTLWVTEIDSGDVNKAFRIISWPGSPILDELGIETYETCTYMNDNIKSVIADIVDRKSLPIEKGGIRDIFHGAVCWPEIDNGKHEEATGVPASECKVCQKVLQSKLINIVRSKNEDQQKGFRSTIAGLVGPVNKTLGG